MAQDGHKITCYNRSGHHVSGAEFDKKTNMKAFAKNLFQRLKKGISSC